MKIWEKKYYCLNYNKKKYNPNKDTLLYYCTNHRNDCLQISYNNITFLDIFCFVLDLEDINQETRNLINIKDKQSDIYNIFNTILLYSNINIHF